MPKFFQALVITAVILGLCFAVFLAVLRAPNFTRKIETEQGDTLNLQGYMWLNLRVVIKHKGELVLDATFDPDKTWNKPEQKHDLPITFIGEKDGVREYTLYDETFFVPRQALIKQQ